MLAVAGDYTALLQPMEETLYGAAYDGNAPFAIVSSTGDDENLWRLAGRRKMYLLMPQPGLGSGYRFGRCWQRFT